MTSAWNTSLSGHKLWVMFPFNLPKWIVNGKNVQRRDEDSEAIDYFWHHLQRIKQREGPIEGMIECVQHPGETIFVPGGWWHAVLNLDDTMAVTQNYCGEANFDRVWRRLRVSRKKLSEYFLRCLREKEPEYYKRALKMNLKDRFVFYTQKRRGNYVLDVSTATFTDSTSSSSSSSSYPSQYSDPEDETKAKSKKKSTDDETGEKDSSSDGNNS